MSKKSIIFLAFFILLLMSQPVVAVKFIKVAKDGTRIYLCQKFCGKVRVRRIGKNKFRVYSIPYSGEMKADSFDDAAAAACKESENAIESLPARSPSRNSPSC